MACSNPANDGFLKLWLGDVVTITEAYVDQDARVAKLGHGAAESPGAGPELQHKPED